MSRYGDYDGEEFNNQGDLWAKSAALALAGKRGRKALAELREALLNLPEKRLIERALCTVGLTDKVAAMPEREQITHHRTGESISVENSRRRDLLEIVTEQGEGVCAVGAFLWWRKVKAGMDPAAAFADLPVLPDTEDDISETALVASEQAGITYSLAWELAYRNDETYESMSAEERYGAFLRWIDKELAKPPLKRPEPRVRKRRRRGMGPVDFPAMPVRSADALELGL